MMALTSNVVATHYLYKCFDKLFRCIINLTYTANDVEKNAVLVQGYP
jgi:hypothetical protein